MSYSCYKEKFLMEKVDILSLDVKDLQDILKEHKINGFVARQIYDFFT